MKRSLLLFFFLNSILFSSFSQQQDAVFWGGVGIQKMVSKRFSVNVFNQYTFNQNYTELGNFYFDIGFNFKINNNFSVSGNYRFIQSRNLDNFYTDRQRLYGDLSYRKSFGNFSVSFRTRFQSQYYGLSFIEHENYKPNRYYSRNLLTLRYKLNYTYSLYVSREQFFHWNTINKTDSWRTSIGAYYTIDMYKKIALFYTLQQSINVKYKKNNYITGVSYYYKF